MDWHATMIMKCAAFHKTIGMNSGGSFNMIFPLKIASLMAPSTEVMDQAQETILKWGLQRGLKDSIHTSPCVGVECGRLKV